MSEMTSNSPPWLPPRLLSPLLPRMLPFPRPQLGGVVFAKTPFLVPPTPSPSPSPSPIPPGPSSCEYPNDPRGDVNLPVPPPLRPVGLPSWTVQALQRPVALRFLHCFFEKPASSRSSPQAVQSFSVIFVPPPLTISSASFFPSPPPNLPLAANEALTANAALPDGTQVACPPPSPPFPPRSPPAIFPSSADATSDEYQRDATSPARRTDGDSSFRPPCHHDGHMRVAIKLGKEGVRGVN